MSAVAVVVSRRRRRRRRWLVSRPLPVDLVEDASEDGKHDDDDDGDDDADDAPQGHRGRVGEVVHGVNSWMTHCGGICKEYFLLY